MIKYLLMFSLVVASQSVPAPEPPNRAMMIQEMIENYNPAVMIPYGAPVAVPHVTVIRSLPPNNSNNPLYIKRGNPLDSHLLNTSFPAQSLELINSTGNLPARSPRGERAAIFTESSFPGALFAGHSSAFMREATMSTIQRLDRYYTAYDYEDVTIAGTSIGFTAAKLKPADKAYRADLVSVGIECPASSPCDIRMTLDGVTTPTASVGLLLEADTVFDLYGYDNLKNARFIRTGANSAVLHTIYYYQR
jgi:hypothetical protein